MSIYVSRLTLGHDSLDPDGSIGRVIAYPGNNLRRLTDRWPNGWAETAHVPYWCVPGHDHHSFDSGTDAPLGDWLRLSVGTEGAHAYVLIDEDAARALAADLLAWVAAEKVSDR